MTDRRDAPEAKAPGAPDAAASVAPMTRERGADVTATTSATPASRSVSGVEGGEPAKDPQLGRRKLLYAAPAVMSQSMFYALAGCGKAQPQQLNCFRVPRSGS